MKLAIENTATHWSYVEAVLRDWVDKGYRSLDDVHAARLANKLQMKQTFKKKPTRQEYIPDWFHNRDQAYEPQHSPTFEEEKIWLRNNQKNFGNLEPLAHKDPPKIHALKRKKDYLRNE